MPSIPLIKVKAKYIIPLAVEPRTKDRKTIVVSTCLTSVLSLALVEFGDLYPHSTSNMLVTQT